MADAAMLRPPLDISQFFWNEINTLCELYPVNLGINFDKEAKFGENFASIKNTLKT